MRKSRKIGGVYLLYFISAIVGTAVIAPKFPLFGEAVVFASTLVYAALTVLLYYLLKPVSPGISLVAACFSLVGCVVTALGTLHVAVPVNPLAFFGPFCILIGYLIARSTILPRILGVLMVLAGIAWLGDVVPPLAHLFAKPAMVLGFLAEALLMLWLLIVGVDVPLRETRAGGSVDVLR